MSTNFKQTDVGLIPEDWEVESLKNLQSERIPSINPAIYKDEEFEYYSIPAYQDGGIPYIELGKKIQSNKLLLKKGSVLFGKLNPRVEKVWQVQSHTQLRKIGSTEWIPILPKADVNSDFLYFLEWSDYVMPKAKQLVSGSTPSRQRVDPTSFYKLKIPLPPLPEQKKIAHVLSKIQQSIETQEQIIKKTQELKKALMQKLFTEGLNGEPQKQTVIGPIPESWKVINLEDTGDVVYGIQAAVAHLKEPIGLPILTNKNITIDGEIDLSELNYFELKTKRHFATVLKKGDILFNWRSGSKEHVGKTAFFELDGEYVHSSFILRIRPKRDVNNKYLFYYLSYLKLSEYFIKLHSYSINAKFNKSAVNKLPTVIPSLGVQELVAKYLTNIDLKIKSEENRLLNLKNLFKTSLNNLMTGQIRVKDIEFKIEDEKVS